MNKIIFTLLAALLSSIAFGQNYSNLTIGTSGGPNLKIRFAGKQYSLQDPKVTFQSLTPGSYPLVIYQLQNKLNGQEFIEVFNNNITLTAQKHLEVMVMRFGKVVWDEGYIAKDDWNKEYQNPFENRQQANRDRAIDNAQFQKIMQTLGSVYVESEKIATAKTILKTNLLNTTQIKAIMATLYVETNKLEFAKFAYDYCTDKGSYFTLTDQFYSSANKTDLMNFINSK